MGDWAKPLSPYLKNPEFRNIFNFVRGEYDTSKCFPPQNKIFNAFQRTSFQNLKVVILGSSPSIKFNEAMGLSYSVPKSVECTPVIRNMYKALTKDSKIDFAEPKPMHGDLENWTNQGVLMLNNVLSVKEGRGTSMIKAGWPKFIHEVIKTISKNNEGIIFLTWGGKAQKLIASVDPKKHHILKYSHPSPLMQKLEKFED